MLQKKLLQEQEPNLSKLLRIAEQWQDTDSMQTAYGSKIIEGIRKASEYKNQIKENWKNKWQMNDCWSLLDKCQGC